MLFNLMSLPYNVGMALKNKCVGDCCICRTVVSIVVSALSIGVIWSSQQ